MNDQKYRKRQVSEIPRQIGVYALCDPDEFPIYVGQSTDGIRMRVQRHLTSARSDVIANRLIDVWEIAYVWSWPVRKRSVINPLEAYLYHKFNSDKTLMNGTVPKDPGKPNFPIPECVIVQVMEQGEIEARLNPAFRFPRQIEHVGRLLDHILNVKDNSELRRSLIAHFERLTNYYAKFMNSD